jgi:hypothetical protein
MNKKGIPDLDERELDLLEEEIGAVFRATRTDVSGVQVSRMAARLEAAIPSRLEDSKRWLWWLFGGVAAAAAVVVLLVSLPEEDSLNRDTGPRLAVMDVRPQDLNREDTSDLGIESESGMESVEWYWEEEPLLAAGGWEAQDEFASVLSFELFYEPLPGADHDEWAQVVDSMLAEKWD